MKVVFLQYIFLLFLILQAANYNFSVYVLNKATFVCVCFFLDGRLSESIRVGTCFKDRWAGAIYWQCQLYRLQLDYNLEY